LAAVNELAARGHQVTVLAAGADAFNLVLGADWDLAARVDRRVQVVRVDQFLGTRDPVLNRCAQADAATPENWRGWTSDLVKSIFPEPIENDWYPAWLLPAAAAARALHAAHPFDLVVANILPAVGAGVGLDLVRATGLPLLLVERDSWVFSPFTGQPYPDAERTRPLLEEALGRAARVWYTNRAMADLHRREFPQWAGKIRLVGNGWDPEWLPQPVGAPERQAGRGLVFRYVGTAYSAFPWERVLRAWRLARAASPRLAGARLEFVGKSSRSALGRPQDAIGFAGVANRRDLPALYRQTDALLFIKEDVPLATPGKLYEYIATGLPVVVALPPGHCAKQDVLAGRPLWFEARDATPEALAQALVAAAEHSPTPAETAAALRHAARFTRAAQLGPALADLEQALGWDAAPGAGQARPAPASPAPRPARAAQIRVLAVGGPRAAAPPAELEGLPVKTVPLDALEACPAPPAGQIELLWALDEAAHPAARARAGAAPGILALTTEQAVQGAVEQLRSGRALADLAYPPAPTPGRAVEQANPPPAGAARWRVETRDQGAPGPWLELTGAGVRVNLRQLEPLERAAVARRQGLARPRGAGGHLLIGRMNYANQGRLWAQAVSDHVDGFTAANLMLKADRTPLSFDADCAVLTTQRSQPLMRLDVALDMAAPASHILIEDMRTLLDTADPREVSLDPAWARAEAEQILASGRRVAVLVHGTAGRTPAAHAAIEPYSPYRDTEAEFTQQRVALTEAVHQALAALEAPVFTATPDMLDFLPQAVWLPITVAASAFAPAPRWADGAKLRVAHIPSSDITKGSVYADAALKDLDRLGLIEYRSLRRIHPARMPQVIRSVDVVVDQLVLGNAATLAAESMAAGRLVVGHVAEPVRRRFPLPLPVVEATPATIRDVVADIALAAEDYRPLAEAGAAFARAVHDGRLAAEVLERGFLRAS
jgi:glycosyltransferase involved in cell wall biosynthesis